MTLATRSAVLSLLLVEGGVSGASGALAAAFAAATASPAVDRPLPCPGLLLMPPLTLKDSQAGCRTLLSTELRQGRRRPPTPTALCSILKRCDRLLINYCEWREVHLSCELLSARVLLGHRFQCCLHAMLRNGKLLAPMIQSFGIMSCRKPNDPSRSCAFRLPY